MAKFCGKCGSQLQDNAVFCPNCGEALAAPTPEVTPAQNYVPQPQYTPPFTPPAPVKKPFNKKLLIGIIAGVVAAIIAAVVVFVLLGKGGGKSAKGVSETALQAVLNEDGDTLADMTTDLYLETMSSVGYDESDLAEMYEDDIDEVMDYFADDLGSNFDVSYEIEGEIEEMSQAELDEELEGLSALVDLDDYNITGAAEVNAELHAEAFGDSSVVDVTIGLIKEGKTWKLAALMFDY